MPTSSLLQRLKLRHKVAALGVVGMALLLLPLVQVLRYQGMELQWAMAERDRVEPALLAVNLQRALVDHRLSAAQVLAGQRQVDALRRDQQATVDVRLAMLEHRLDQAQQGPALREAQSMRPEWLALVQQVVLRRCTVAQSDDSHRLLVEQALQVIDIISALAPAPADAQLAALVGPLPRALAASLAVPGSDAAAQALSATMASLGQQVQQAQARRIAWHQAQRTLAGGGLFVVGLAMLGTLAWLRRSVAVVPPPLARDPASGPTVWQPPQADGQQAGRQAQTGLLQRLRGGRADRVPPPLDQPTQPHDG